MHKILFLINDQNGQLPRRHEVEVESNRDGRWILGSDATIPAAIMVRGEHVSQLHALLIIEASGDKPPRCKIQDQGSGTTVNWCELPPYHTHLLKAGDLINLGGIEIIFCEAA